jgi:O-succinylbenzoate synthase
MLRQVTWAQLVGELVTHTFAIALTTRFRGITHREGMILGGPAGAGEFSPFWDYTPAESAPWLRAAIEAATLPFPAARRSGVPVNAIVPAVEAQVGAGIVQASGGCRTVKVKVAGPGDTRRSECDRVAAVRDALGAGGAIRIDANGAWDADTAVERLAVLDRVARGLQYAEQPCRTIGELAAVRRRSHVPIAADESIRRAADPFEVVRRHAADVAVLKVQPLGGVQACLELAAQIGIPVVVSSALETSVGLAMGVALAAALPDLPFACGLGTGQLLTADATGRPLRPVGGVIPVAGMVPVARQLPDRLDAITADAGTRARWSARLREVAGVLSAVAGRG